MSPQPSPTPACLPRCCCCNIENNFKTHLKFCLRTSGSARLGSLKRRNEPGFLTVNFPHFRPKLIKHLVFYMTYGVCIDSSNFLVSSKEHLSKYVNTTIQINKKYEPSSTIKKQNICIGKILFAILLKSVPLVQV